MKQAPKKLDAVAMEGATRRAKNYVADAIDLAVQVQNDTLKADREKRGECKACFYLHSGIGGAAMTTRACASCGVDQQYSSTCTDALCDGCAKRLGLCRLCGGDVDMKLRRKWPTIGGGNDQANV